MGVRNRRSCKWSTDFKREKQVSVTTFVVGGGVTVATSCMCEVSRVPGRLRTAIVFFSQHGSFACTSPAIGRAPGIVLTFAHTRLRTLEVDRGHGVLWLELASSGLVVFTLAGLATPGDAGRGRSKDGANGWYHAKANDL